MEFDHKTLASRRHLPHLQKRGATYYVTFSTRFREVLFPEAMTIALRCCVHDHQLTYWLHVAVVMPDHVHFVITPHEEWSLSKILRRVKGNSSHLINVALRRRGPLWQEESFDRIARNSEDLRKKCKYIAENPVRAELCNREDEYPWLWREWIEGAKE